MRWRPSSASVAVASRRSAPGAARRGSPTCNAPIEMRETPPHPCFTVAAWINTTGCGASPRTRPCGEVAEWLKAPHSKCGILARVSGVRIPPSPPIHFEISVECWGLIEQPPVSPPRGIAVRLTADLAISAISFCLACAGQHRLLTRWLRMCTTWLSADMSV